MTLLTAAPDERKGHSMAGHYVKLEFLSLKENVDFACEAVSVFMRQFNPTKTEIDDTKTIISEAVMNSVAHGYTDKPGVVVIKAKMLKNNTLKIIVRDWGKGIANVEQARRPMFTTGGEERSGMGFTIMESFMDHLKVKSEPGKGTTVIMRKRIAVRAKR